MWDKFVAVLSVGIFMWLSMSPLSQLEVLSAISCITI